MIRIGLTGGIATGKSLALEFFKRCGAATADADAIAHACLEPGEEGYRRVVDAFGTSVITPDGSIDRVKLGTLVFSDPAQRERLNQLLHPIIIERLREMIRSIHIERPNAVIIADVPLLFECGLEHDFDATIVVTAPPEVQKQRLMLRNNLTPEAADQRIASQMPLDLKILRADYVIDNSGTVNQLEAQVQKIFAELLHRGSAKPL